DIFRSSAPYRRDVVTLTNLPEPEQVFALRTSARLFSMLGVPARLGRPLIDSDDAANAPNDAVLSNRMWQRTFHGDPNVIGKSITISDEQYTVVGVMPPEFEFPLSDTEMWLPLHIDPQSNFGLQVAAEVQDGHSIGQAQSAMDIVAQELVRQDSRNAGLRIR